MFSDAGHMSILRGADNLFAPKGDPMTGILFLLCPVIFGGLCLLLGDVFNWLKQEHGKNDLVNLRVVLHSGRK
jgi:hypothetical protein